MRLLRSALAALAALAVVAASAGPATPARPVSTAEDATWAGAAVATAEREMSVAAALTARLAQLDAGSVDLAVAALDRRTGRSYTYSPTTQFRTASIVKVDILATLLLQASRAGRQLTAAEKSLAATMIRNSDNDAASTLWRRTGGIDTSLATFGLTTTRQGADGDWGETLTTAEDQLRLLAQLADPAGAAPGGDYVLGLMAAVASGQDWGVSAAARAGEATALKNGWYPLSGGWLLNSVGRITGADTDLLVVVLSRGHSSYPSGVGVVEAAATAVRTALVQ